MKKTNTKICNILHTIKKTISVDFNIFQLMFIKYLQHKKINKIRV